MKINKLFCLLICFTFCLYSHTQDNKDKQKGFWLANSNIGLIQVEIENLGTFNAHSYGNSLGKEFLLKNNSSFVAELELQNVHYNSNFNNADYHSKNTFLKIPIHYRYSLNNNLNTGIFIDLGFYGSLLFKSDIEMVNSSETERNLGSNFGLSFRFGFTQKINDFLNFNVSMFQQADLMSKYKKEFNEFKLKSLYGINLGIGLRLL